MINHCTTLATLVFALLGIFDVPWLSAEEPKNPTAEVVEPRIRFNRDIRPILSDSCFRCHGFDEAKREGGVRLDIREQAIKEAESGDTPIVPHHVDKSEIMKRVMSDNPDSQMPPKGKRLTKKQIATLKKWIDQGAEYEGHWAFITPERPEVPKVKNSKWPKNEIDNFILRNLEREKLVPSKQVAKEILLRRVTLDLIGLPPTPEELKAFLADDSPNAYEKVVDRLLASPHYGERMATQWLDYARYADSNGFQIDRSRSMWPWRDWVIKAFNDNMPFDQFTVEQLAGDMLPKPTQSQLIATGFNRNNRHNGEGGSIEAEWRVENVIDRVETTGTTWMALTFNCCRCHDHKYDPITQKEFYQFYAIFNNTTDPGLLNGDKMNQRPYLSLPSKEVDDLIKKSEKQAAKYKTELDKLQDSLPAYVEKWESASRDELVKTELNWTPMKPAKVSGRGISYVGLADETYLGNGPSNPVTITTINATSPFDKVTGILLEVLPDETMPQEGYGASDEGRFILTAFEMDYVDEKKKTQTVKFGRAVADFSETGNEVEKALDDEKKSGWSVSSGKPKNPRPHRAMFLTDGPLKLPKNTSITIRMRCDADDAQNIGRFRMAITNLPAEKIALDGVIIADATKKILAIDPEKRTAEQTAKVQDHYLKNVLNPIQEKQILITKKNLEVGALKKRGLVTMVMDEGKVQPSYILERGQYDKQGEKVSASLPAALPALPADTKVDRLSLARWMMDPKHPLTSRVWVNRIWEKFFGLGIVRSTENFGSQADWPSNPELLDWLATDFMRNNWDMKAIQKKIVMSATYQQSSLVTPELLRRDPENVLLARGPRFRLAGELLRDQALAVSGLLVDTIGGSSVRPYMPEGVWSDIATQGDLVYYKQDSGDALYRRTMYTFWKRTAPPPTLALMDVPARDICVVKRSRTNTPMQSLSLLNEITFVEAARKLGERIMTHKSESLEDRLRYGFTLVTCRAPDADELAVLVSGWKKDKEKYQKQPDEAKKLLGFGESVSSDSLNASELAAYTLTANVLLNLDEVVTRE